MFCPYCGSSNDPTNAFCLNCGKLLPTGHPPVPTDSVQDTPATPESDQPLQPESTANSAPVMEEGLTCPRCGHPYHPPYPPYCQMCGSPLTPKTRTALQAESQAAPPQDPYQRTQDEQPPFIRQPSDPNKPIPAKIIKFLGPRTFWTLGAILIILVGAFVLLRKPPSSEDSRFPACQPSEPNQNMEPANEHDLDGDLPRDSYFESGQEYTIRENGVLHIPKGSTLLIQPGALVKFGSGAKMVVEGELIACGTKSRRILFTADTRNGTPGFWKGIEFIRADDRSVLGHATFEYAGNSYHPVIQLDGTNLRIEDLKFDANKYYSLSLSPDSFPELRQPYNVDNGPSGWEIRGGTLDDDLTWDASQPLVIQGTLAIAQGRTLTVNAGTHVKFLPNAQIQVYGKIRALGTASQHIQVTAAASELAEPGQSPSNDPWSGLVFKGTDSSAEMVYVDYQYEEQEENP